MINYIINITLIPYLENMNKHLRFSKFSPLLIHISQEAHSGSVSKVTHIQNTHLFNFLTSPAQSQIFSFV